MLKWQTSPPNNVVSYKNKHSGYFSDFSYEPSKSNENKKEKGYFSDSENIKFTRFSFEPKHIEFVRQQNHVEGYQLGFMVEDNAKTSGKNISNANTKFSVENSIIDDKEVDESIESSSDDGSVNEDKIMQDAVIELAHWISRVTNHSLPKNLEVLSELKDGKILTRFIRIIDGTNSKFKKIKESLNLERKMGDINTFLRLCRKLCVKREDLFTEDDWKYVTENYSENSMHNEEWNERFRKVLMAFFCLAGKLKSTKRSHHVNGININSLNVEESYSSSHRDRDNRILSDRSLRTSDDSDTTLRRTKKVTFHENVIKRHPSLESADDCSVNVTLYDQEEIEVFPSIHISGEYINDSQMNEYKTNGYVASLLDEFPPYSYQDYNKRLTNRDQDFTYSEPYISNISEKSHEKRCSVNERLDDSNESYVKPNGDISLDKLDSENLEFLTFHSHLNVDENNSKKNFRFSLNSPRIRQKFRDHNNNTNNSNSTGSINTTGSIKKRDVEPEYWRTDDINTLERKKVNKLASSSSFRKEKNPFNSFSRTKSAGNLSGGSFRSKLVTKFASLNLRQEPQRSNTPGASPSTKRRFSLKRRSSFNSKVDVKPVQPSGSSLQDSHETLESLSTSNASLDEPPMNFGIAARKIHENSQYHTFDSSQNDTSISYSNYDSIGKSSTLNKESLSRKEIKDLNNLLTLFDMDKVTSSSSDDETNASRPQSLLLNTSIDSQQFTEQSTKDATDSKPINKRDASNNNIPKDLSEVLNDLLSVGNSNSITKTNDTEECFLSRQNTLTKRSIENFFDRNNIFSEIENFENLKSDSSHSNYSTDSDSCFEIDDSGIDDTMPGLPKDYAEENKSDRHKHRSENDKSKSKRKSEHGHRRRKHGERKHRREDDRGDGTIRRSHSEPRKSSKKESNDRSKKSSNERSDSVPRSSAYSTKRDDNYKETKERGRQKERRSEPPVPTRPTNYTKTKRTEPIVTNKIINKNDIEGGALGVYKRTLTEPISNKVTNKNIVLSRKNNGELNTSNNITVKRNNSVQLSPKAREYMWDTADGKHRVYVRSKEEKNIQASKYMDGHTNAEKSDIADKLGLSPELMDMLKEEEKFWQKQQELKYWRKTRDQAEMQEQDETNDYNVSKYRNNSYEKREKIRELEENRLEREASLLMKVRAEQEYALQTSRENLLNDIRNRHNEENQRSSCYNKNFEKTYNGSYDHYDERDSAYSRPNKYINENRKYYSHIPPTNRQIEVRTNYSTRDNIPSSGYKSSSTASPRDFDERSYSPISPRYPPYQNGYSSATTELSRRSSNDQAYSKYILQSGCFSDDDEVFYSRRQNKRDDSRGYFSDHDSQLIGRIYNARPMINSQNLHIICTACSRVVSDERLMTSEVPHYFWHLKCFFCVVCKAFLNDSHTVRIRVVDHKLHCRYCFSAQNGEQLSEV